MDWKANHLKRQGDRPGSGICQAPRPWPWKDQGFPPNAKPTGLRVWTYRIDFPRTLYIHNMHNHEESRVFFPVLSTSTEYVFQWFLGQRDKRRDDDGLVMVQIGRWYQEDGNTLSGYWTLIRNSFFFLSFLKYPCRYRHVQSSIRACWNGPFYGG